MPNENLLSMLEQGLKQARSAKTRLRARLVEIEAEADTIRVEIGEMDALIAQTEAAICRLMSSVLGTTAAINAAQASDIEIEAALRADAVVRQPSARVPRASVPPVRSRIEATSDRFLDRTIPHCTSVLLRECNGPLHVNEIYNRLCEGGFQFTGHNPTISIAVSLNRNGRFRKVAPGTFDLVMRDASSQAS